MLDLRRPSPALPALCACLAALTLTACGCPADPADEASAADGADLTSSFGAGFKPSPPVSSGFGGGPCTARRTPVVFLHGNADRASSWGKPASDGGPSVLAAFRAAGWQPCELYGPDWLTTLERNTPSLNYHSAARARLVRGFLDDVRRATGQPQVDLVAHSMGVTLALLALEDPPQRAGVRRLVAIAGALRGLESCRRAGPANPLALTCGSQSLFASDTFGFYPAENPRLEARGFRTRPALGGPRYYSIRAGESDQILAPGYDSARFDDGDNVWAQLDVGRGHPSVTLSSDDSEGVGHFRARSDSGPLLGRLLGSDCRGQDCCSGTPSVCR